MAIFACWLLRLLSCRRSNSIDCAMGKSWRAPALGFYSGEPTISTAMFGRVCCAFWDRRAESTCQLRQGKSAKDEWQRLPPL